MTERTAPEIRQIPVSDFDTSVLPPDARAPGMEAFEIAVGTHFASHYAARGWNAAVTVDEEFIRIVAVPETGVEPKEYVLGLLPEQIDPATGAFLGNFPQAFSHMGLIASGIRLSRARSAPIDIQSGGPSRTPPENPS